jgi:DNA-binding transcriptional MerR regulator
MAPPVSYTAAELAHAAGVPLRTVRYYVQEGLIDRPEGRGRGAHFTERHLHQLQRARAYQFAGLDNASIRRHADELEAILDARGLSFASFTAIPRLSAISMLATLGRLPLASEEDDLEAEEDEDEDEAVDPATALRIPLASGIELLVAPGVETPSPRRLVKLAFYVRRIFGLK